jgi:hypothetical protein
LILLQKKTGNEKTFPNQIYSQNVWREDMKRIYSEVLAIRTGESAWSEDQKIKHVKRFTARPKIDSSSAR